MYTDKLGQMTKWYNKNVLRQFVDHLRFVSKAKKNTKIIKADDTEGLM